MVIIHMQPKVIGSSKDAKTEKNSSKMKKLVDYLVKIEEQNFTGYIKVNFSQGAVGRIEKFEEILKK